MNKQEILNCIKQGIKVFLNTPYNAYEVVSNTMNTHLYIKLKYSNTLSPLQEDDYVNCFIKESV